MYIVKKIIKKFYYKLEALNNSIEFFFFSRKYKIKVMSSIKTIKYIQKKKCSVSRYGDGELNMIIKGKNIGFQHYNKELTERLKNVLFSNGENVLVCLPHQIHFFNGECLRAKDFWRNFLIANKEIIYKMLCDNGMKEYCFGDTQITRPYIDYASVRNANRIYRELKKLWNNRRILIVEGFATRMGVGNDLFNNTRLIRRIVCPAENAYECYEEIKNTVIEKCLEDLVLIALGPTATVLAADLSKHGIWAIDVGHLDVEYEWYINRVKEKKEIMGKYVNEVPNGQTMEECLDQIYLSQIISKIVK